MSSLSDTTTLSPPVPDEATTVDNPAVGIDQTAGNFSYKVDYAFDAGTGLSEDTIRYISSVKKEAPWILEFRLAALKKFLAMPMPTHWATKDLENIDFQKIRYYLSQGQKPKRTWDEVPDDIKKTFERLGIPEQERKFLAGVEAQFDSEAAYSNIKDIVAKQGVIFVNSTEGLREHPELFKKFFGKVIPTGDNKFSALNSAVFSGGSFIYVPKGVKVAQPLQAYFRINAENFGQFERTLIIADEGAEVTYMEGCTAPKFSTSTLHSAVVELVALKGAKIQYITVQNWANNVFNLVTKRGVAHEDAEIKWIDCNIGSRLTMKYPGVVLKGERARGEVISIALANDGQHQVPGSCNGAGPKVETRSLPPTCGHCASAGAEQRAPPLSRALHNWIDFGPCTLDAVVWQRIIVSIWTKLKRKCLCSACGLFDGSANFLPIK